jgi:hypothetical protein
MLRPGSFSIAILTVLVFSCKKESTTGGISSPHIVLHSGNNQVSHAGWLIDTLKFGISKMDTLTPSRLYFEYKTIDNNGEAISFTGNPTRPDASGNAKALWRLGCNNGPQKLGIYLYLAAQPNGYPGTLIDSLIVSATATAPLGWTKSCGDQSANYHVQKFLQRQNLIYLLASNEILVSDDQGKSWKFFNDVPPGTTSILDFAFKNDGSLYVMAVKTNYAVGIFSSSNLGLSWSEISNGLGVAGYGPHSIYIEDSVMFASMNGTYRSRDNGASWQRLTINGFNTIGFRLIKRHASGALYMFDFNDQFYRSSNSGDSWQLLTLSQPYVSTPIYGLTTDVNNNIVITSYGRISLLSPPTLTGVVTWVPSSFPLNQVLDVQNINNTLYFSSVGNTEQGIFKGNNGNYAPENIDFFASLNILKFLLKSDGSYLLATNNGVYFKGQ